MFWRKKPEISKRKRKILLEDIKQLKNYVIHLNKELDNLRQTVEELE